MPRNEREAVVSRRGVWGIAAALAAAAAAIAFFLPGSPPQMGADEETFKTVDALFTAVSSRDPKRLDDCRLRLRALQESGKLPGEAAAHLDPVLQQAARGDWEPAAKKLYEFMLRQRREPATPPRSGNPP